MIADCQCVSGIAIDRTIFFSSTCTVMYLSNWVQSLCKPHPIDLIYLYLYKLTDEFQTRCSNRRSVRYRLGPNRNTTPTLRLCLLVAPLRQCPKNVRGSMALRSSPKPTVPLGCCRSASASVGYKGTLSELSEYGQGSEPLRSTHSKVSARY